MTWTNRILELLAAKTLVISQVEEEIKEARFETCKSCIKWDKTENRCKVCGCFLAVKTGTKENWNPKRMRYEITYCPLGKWDDLELANHYRNIDGLAPLN